MNCFFYKCMLIFFKKQVYAKSIHDFANNSLPRGKEQDIQSQNTNQKLLLPWSIFLGIYHYTLFLFSSKRTIEIEIKVKQSLISLCSSRFIKKSKNNNPDPERGSKFEPRVIRISNNPNPKAPIFLDFEIIKKLKK